MCLYKTVLKGSHVCYFGIANWHPAPYNHLADKVSETLKRVS